MHLARAKRFAISVATPVALVACAQILGVSDYQVGSGARAPASCGANAVPGGDAGCETIGVPAGSCPSGTTSDAKGGGCTAILPDAPCDASTCGTDTACLGAPEELGQKDCVATSSVWVSCRTMGDFPLGPLGIDAVKLRYVSRSFSGQGDGKTASAPLTTIKAALDDVPEGGAVLVAAGTYAEDLVLTKPGVQLVGACPQQVVIQGSGALAPEGSGYPCTPAGPKSAVCVASSASGSSIQGVNVTGTGDGIAVVGATEVTLAQLEVTQTERYGIRVEELGQPDGARTAAAVKLSVVSVRGARGAGIYVAGAKLDTDATSFVNVSGTRPMNDYLGYGINVVPGAIATDAQPVRTRAEVALTSVVLLGNADAAVHVTGSSVTITDSFLGNLEGVADPMGPGIAVELDATMSNNPADVNVKRTIIQRTRDVAIDVASAQVTLDAVTIRDTLGRSSDGCSGQGIRLRADRLAPATATVSHSLIEGTRQAAIHALGSKVSIDHSILRDTAPDDTTAAACKPHLGDGVTLESLPSPGEASALTLDHSLIAGNARAAIASFGGTVTATGSVLSCNRHGLVAESDLGGARSDLWCGCDQGLSACEVDHRGLEPWISPGAGSGHAGATEDWRVPVQIGFSGRKLTQGVAFLLRAPDVAPGFPDQQGCATLRGVPKDGESRRVAAWAETNEAGTWQYPAGSKPSCGDLIGVGSTENAASLSGQPLDMNKAIVMAFPPAPTTVLQNPESGSSWQPKPFNGQLRYNVDPGWHDFSFSNPDGVVCEARGGTGLRVPDAPNTQRLLVEPAMVADVLWPTCYSQGLCPGGFADPVNAGQCLSGPAAQAACAGALSNMAAGTPYYGPDCASCVCAGCLRQYSACMSDATCLEFLRCASPTGCHDGDCTAACAAQWNAITQNGGQAAIAVDNCQLASGCQSCNFPGPDGG